MKVSFFGYLDLGRNRLLAMGIVEVLVVLAIVAVLMAVSIIGLGQAQVSARDEERKSLVAKISAAVDSYYRETSGYPSVMGGEIQWDTFEVNIGDEAISLEGYLSYSATSTDAGQTRYTYKKDAYGYVICALLENGKWHKTGSGNATCP